MRTILLFCCFIACLVASEEGTGSTPDQVQSITHHHITWTFDKAYPSGRFANGDYWILGPVVVTSISNDLNEERFTIEAGHNGSMLNPGATGKQGYDKRLHSYKAELNAALIDGKPISADNPLNISNNSTLISMVSWLYNSKTDTEKGCPKFNGGTKAPRPVTRIGAILTVLSEAPAPGSFRPAYCGDNKAILFNITDIDFSKLLELEPVKHTPMVEAMAKRMSRPWIDHVHEYLGAMVHPSMNLPNYGREMCGTANTVALMLHLKMDKAEKMKLLIPYIQYGIDCFGITQVGGGWPANGGHGMGRKLPILAAGTLLNDQAMLDIGKSKTRFHDDEQTFYVEEIDIERSHSDKWKPDSRAADKLSYSEEHLGMPEWGIRHFLKPFADNRGWRTPYRDINNTVLPGTALAASMFQLREAWNHDALFDYARRIMHEPKVSLNKINSTNAPDHFSFNMWQAYAKAYVNPIEWKPEWSASKAKDASKGNMDLKKKKQKKK